MKKEAKSRKHTLCEKAPLVAMFLAAVLALLFLFQYNRKTKVILEPLGLLPNALEEKIKI